MTTPLTKEELIEVLEERTRKHSEDPIHAAHHEFVQAMIDERQRRIAMWAKFQSSLIGGIALSFLGLLGWIGNLVINWIRHGGTQ